jgi:hypothetical protein
MAVHLERQPTKDHPSFEVLTGWLAGHADPGLLETDDFFVAVHETDLASSHGPFSDEELTEQLGLEDDDSINDDLRVDLLKSIVRACFENCRGEDHLPMFQVRHFDAGDGVVGAIGYSTTGFSFTDIEVEWHGIYQDLESFQQALEADGWITSPEYFESKSSEHLIRLWSR